MAAPRERGGLFAYTDGADLVSLSVIATYIQNVSYAAGAMVAEAKNTRLIGCRSLASGGSEITTGEYVGGLIGTGDNVSISGGLATITLTGENVGGIAGRLLNSSISGASYQTFSITVSADGGYGGGVVGYMENGTIASSHYDVQSKALNLIDKLTSTYPNVSMGTLAGYLKNVDVRSIYTTERCPVVVAERENSTIGMVGTLDGGSIKGVYTCGTIVAYGVNSTAGGLVGRLKNNASVEDVIVAGNMIGLDAGSVPVSGSVVGGIVGEAVGGTVKGALALHSGITGETVNTLVAANAGANISKSYHIIGIRRRPDSNSVYAGGISRYEIYDNKTFFDDVLGWDIDNSSVWEMRIYDELPLLKGSGSDYIPITTAEELYNIGFSPTTLSRRYVLMNDIDLSTFNGGIWKSIGVQAPTPSTKNFTGVFNGNNKRIINLRVGSADDTLSVGLFRTGNNGVGVVRNLIIENFIITYVNGGNVTGAPLGSGITARNVHTTGIINSAPDATMGFRFAAGVVIGNSNGGSCADCSFLGSINIRDGNASPTEVAGISTGSVSTSKSSGTINVRYSGSSSSLRVGGISLLDVQSSYSDMDITVRYTGASPSLTRSYAQVGGITHTATAATRYNYFAGSINLSSEAGAYNYAGGIAAAVVSQSAVIKTNLVLTDRITVDDPAINNYGRIIGLTYHHATYPERNPVALENYALPTLPNGVDKVINATNPATSNAVNVYVANGTDLTGTLDTLFLESLEWDMSLWKPVTVGTLPKLRWEQ
jgi:hypothetical protein